MDNALSWDQVRYFIAVARAGSAMGAAERLGVGHATVLRNIARLEASLGVRLFDRVRTGYRITSDGEEVLASAHAMEEHRLPGCGKSRKRLRALRWRTRCQGSPLDLRAIER